MTHRERLIRTLKCEKIGGQVPTFELVFFLTEEIRTQSGDEYFLLAHGDPTWAIPDGDHMTEFSVKMFEAPEELNDESQRRLDQALETAYQLDRAGHLLDGFGLCSDYCFNVNPFFPDDLFGTLIAPYLKAVLDGYREMGYYSIKHTDGNIMPILKEIAACGPGAKPENVAAVYETWDTLPIL